MPPKKQYYRQLPTSPVTTMDEMDEEAVDIEQQQQQQQQHQRSAGGGGARFNYNQSYSNTTYSNTSPPPTTIYPVPTTAATSTTTTGHPQHKSSRAPKPPTRTTKMSQKLVVFPEGSGSGSGGKIGGGNGSGSCLTGGITDVASDYGADDEDVGVGGGAGAILIDEDNAEHPHLHHHHQLPPSHTPQPHHPRAHQVVHYSYDIAKEKEAERIRRIDKENLARVTAFCTAKSYDMEGIMKFLNDRRSTNDTNPKRIDECIYSTYSPSISIFEFPSPPPPPNASASGTSKSFTVRPAAPTTTPTSTTKASMPPKVCPAQYPAAPVAVAAAGRAITPSPGSFQTPPTLMDAPLLEHTSAIMSPTSTNTASPTSTNTASPNTITNTITTPVHDNDDADDAGLLANKLRDISTDPSSARADGPPLPVALARSPPVARPPPPPSRAPPRQIGELFFFDYGVVVFWGLSETQEMYLLSLLKPFEQEKLDPDDVETEDFRYQYRPLSQARIFNDVITLRTPTNQQQSSSSEALSDAEDRFATGMMHTQDHMIKLTISHAMAQSVKLTLFEGRIEDSIDTTKHIPMVMALTGKVPMSRTAIVKKIGQLFVMRINVNLVSPILDTPEIFWSEPSLEPLYSAIRGYLEISQRVELLNQRCAVISDLLDMLKEHLNSTHGETLEWIIIILIGIEILIGLVTIFFEFFQYYGKSAE